MVRSVISRLTVRSNTLVEAHAVIRERVDEVFLRALDLALRVGVLDAQIAYAARRVRESLDDQRGKERAEMEKPRRARRKARHLRALR